jgi:hypothetical protein
MIDGSLRALDSPAELKRTALPGAAWDVFAEPVLEALAEVEADEAVVRAGLAGDHLRAITRPGTEAKALRARLASKGLAAVRVEPVEASLEDVFLSLAGEA